jgi:hypothetical protein
MARLDAEAALLEKKANIARGQGEAERKKLVMAADGALAERLKALTKIHENYANAIAQQPIVPQVYMGSEKKGSPRSTDLIDLLTANVAKQVGESAIPAK